MNVNAFNAPLAVKMHVPAPVTTPGVGLESGPQPAKLPKSAGAKPLPETVTVVPTGPDVGLSVILGAELVTVNVA